MHMSQQVMVKQGVTLGSRLTEEGAFFNVWAPKAKTVDVVIEGQKEVQALTKDNKGYFTGTVNGVGANALYKFRIDGKDSFPDPCSRFQPQGPHGPSMVVASEFAWSDEQWQRKGLGRAAQVIYELHVGTFSTSGTYAGVRAQLPHLKELGVTIIELMPLADWPGKFNWGYDGVNLFAPARNYGTPQELKSLINDAHAFGLGVILDVVYNHLGPDGNYLRLFSDDYFSREMTEWGEALNYDGPNSREVREFFIQNACYWIEEYHFDGLRLDATHSIFDHSQPHLLAEISQRVRAAAGGKGILIYAENEPQHVRLVKPINDNGYGLDGLWNDDFHHSVRVALTGRRESYYGEYKGTAQELVALAQHGFLYQGQMYAWLNKSRGTPVTDDIEGQQFVTYMQNHDQVSNSLYGDRMVVETHPAQYRAMTAYFLLSPGTPLLFMGQEWGAREPFMFFADHNPQLAAKVFEGRKAYLAQYPSVAAAQDAIIDPKSEEAFNRCKLQWPPDLKHGAMYRLHHDLLKIRREDEVISRQDRHQLQGAVLNERAFLLRYQHQDQVRLLIVNLGTGFDCSPCPLPHFAPIAGKHWELVWSSQEPSYGGSGTVPAYHEESWQIPANCAQLFKCV